VQQIPNLNKKSKASLVANLRGEVPIMKGKSLYNKKGVAHGRLVGGNLSLITHLLGSTTQLDYKNSILFLEEVSEPLYAIERMLIQLKRAGVLEVINGLAVGINSGLTEDKAIYGESLEEIVLRLCKNYDCPIAFNLPFGHSVENMTLMHGSDASLEVDHNTSLLLTGKH
jgi:muramoyltetrapeptide carboxypeptidase